MQGFNTSKHIPAIAKYLGVTNRTVYNYIKELTRRRALKGTGKIDREFSKGFCQKRWDSDWHTLFENFKMDDMGGVSTFAGDVDYEQLRGATSVVAQPKALPDWDSPKKNKSNPWQPNKNASRWIHKKTLQLSKAQAVLLIDSDSPNGHLTDVVVHVKNLTLPSTELRNDPKIKDELELEILDACRNETGIGLYRFIEWLDTEYATRSPAMDNIDMPEVRLSKNWLANRSRKEDRKGRPAHMETKSLQHMIALADGSEAIVNLKKEIEKVKEDVTNHSDDKDLRLVERIESLERTVVKAIDGFGEISLRTVEAFTDEIKTLPDKIAKKLNKTYESTEEDMPGYL